MRVYGALMWSLGKVQGVTNKSQIPRLSNIRNVPKVFIVNLHKKSLDLILVLF